MTIEINAFAQQALQQAQIAANVAPNILVDVPEDPLPQVLLASDDEADDVRLDLVLVVPVVPKIDPTVSLEPVSDVDDKIESCFILFDVYIVR